MPKNANISFNVEHEARDINKIDNTNFGVKVYFCGERHLAYCSSTNLSPCESGIETDANDDHCTNLTPTGKVIVDFSLSLKNFNS